MSLRDLNQISIERDIPETSQKHLKGDVFFMTSLRRLKHFSKNMSFLREVFKTSRAYLKKDVFSVMSLRRRKNISHKYFWFSKNTSQKMIWCDFVG